MPFANASAQGEDGRFARTMRDMAHLDVQAQRQSLGGRHQVPARLTTRAVRGSGYYLSGNVRCGRCGWPVGHMLYDHEGLPPRVITFLQFYALWGWNWDGEALVPSRYLRSVARFPSRMPRVEENSHEGMRIALPVELAPGARWQFAPTASAKSTPFHAICPKCPDTSVMISLSDLYAQDIERAKKPFWGRVRPSDGWKP